MPNDPTVASFPTYADLTQTLAWREHPSTHLAMSPNIAELSHGSRYTETAVLGVGGMGKVMLARDERIGRDVAVKLLHGEQELTAEERERFLREAQVQGQLEHPAIVPVYDVDRRSDGSTFFTMRRVLGRTLSQILAEVRDGSSKHTQRELLQAFATVCLAVDYAHSRGVVHRDLKPANIMLGDFGEVYVLDWGLARILDPGDDGKPEAAASRLSRPGTVMGTPLYMAPEQMSDPAVGPSADVFSLGAILFEILTLQRLRDPKALYVPVDARPSVRAPDRQVAPELETVCVKATQHDRRERYTSARALQEAIARYLEGDRELEQRRQLATEHARRARDALARAEAAATGTDAEQHRTVAMRELVRALSFDPTNREHVAMFARLMEAPPDIVPPEVDQQVAAEDQALMQLGSKHSMWAMLSWFAFLPLLLWLGIRRLDVMFMAAVPTAAAALLAFIAWRMRLVTRTMQYATLAAMIVACMSLSRLYGPLVLMPTMIATWAVVTQAHPDRRMRIYALALAAIGTALPLTLELLGVLPTSYVFENGRMQILPQMHHLPETPTLVFLTIADVAICIMPAAFVARLRADLATAQRRQLVQTWHFRRLGDVVATDF